MPSYAARKISDPRVQAAVEVISSQYGTRMADNFGIKKLRSLVPFDQFALSGLDYPGLGVGSGIMLASDMPQAFLKAYLERGLYKYDPLSTMVTPDCNWGSWHDLTQADLEKPMMDAIIALQRDHGISTRSAFGFYRNDVRYGGATFAREMPFTPQEVFVLEAGARMIHADISSIYFEEMNNHTGIYQGEIACLRTIANGFSSDECALETGYSVDTVRVPAIATLPSGNSVSSFKLSSIRRAGRISVRTKLWYSNNQNICA